MSEMGANLQKNKKTKKNRAARRFLFVLLLILLFMISGLISYSYVVNSGNDMSSTGLPAIAQDDEIRFDVPLGSSTESIANKLEAEGIINFPLVFRYLSKLNGFDGQYRSGTHLVGKSFSYNDLMRVLSNQPDSEKVLLKEGITAKEAIDILVSKKIVERDEFTNLMNTGKFEYKFLQGLPNRKFKLEGYLFPDTYNFELKSDVKYVIDTMLSNFDKKFKPEYYKRAQQLKMTPDQVIILASLIEGEAAKDEERKIISSVFHNRLNGSKSMRKLQSCATVQYILFEKDGKRKPKLSESDTRIDSPYNTYLNEGLPPGPICSPGVASIEAALYPEDTDYYYFVAKGDGYHEFSTNLWDHQEAMKKYKLFQ